MRRRLLFGKFDRIVLYRNGEVITNLEMNKGDVVNNLEVYGVYKNGRKVRIKNSDCVWTSDSAKVSVVEDSGIITGIDGDSTPSTVKAVYTHNAKTYEASLSVLVHNYETKYFINANDDITIGVNETAAVFGYTLYKTYYDNGAFVSVQPAAETISLTLTYSGDKSGSDRITGNTHSASVDSNMHSTTAKVYIGTFEMGGPDYTVETENFGGYEHRDRMTIVQLADSENPDLETTEYGDLVLAVDKNSLTFANTGGSGTVTATTTQEKIRTTFWMSDGGEKAVYSTTLTDDAAFTWTGSIAPFAIDTTEGRTVNVTAAATASDDDIEKELTVNAVSSGDSSKTASLTVILRQSSKTIVGYEEISLKEGSVINNAVAAKGGDTTLSAAYQQIARWSDNTTTVVDIPATNVSYTQHRFDSLGTTPTSEETVVADGIYVLVNGLGENPSTASFTYDARQEKNELVGTEYLVPVISYGGENPIIIPAAGGSATADIDRVTVSQKKVETYTSEATIEKDADVTGAAKGATTVNASSLGTTSKQQTKVGDSTVSVLVNGKNGTLDIPVEQAANTPHDGARGTEVSYSDWRLYFTNDTTTSSQDIYLDEKFGDDQYIEPDNANNTYNNAEEVYSAIGRMGEAKNIHIRAVRTKSTKYFYSSGSVCHIVKEPDYYGETVTEGLAVSCSGGVPMGVLSEPDGQHIITSVFPNPGSNHTLESRGWTITASIGGKTLSKAVSQTEGTIYWDEKTPTVAYADAEATEGAQSVHTAADTAMSWYWNDEAERNIANASVSYELTGTIPEGTSINANTGIITWPKNDNDSRSVTVKITMTANSGVAGAASQTAVGNVTATQKSGFVVDYYTIESYSLSVSSDSSAVGAAGGSINLVRSGSLVYTETYVSGTTSGEKTKEIPSAIITVTESGDVYSTFGNASWSGANANVAVSSHETNARGAQNVVYTPSVNEDDLKGLFDGTVDSIGASSITAKTISQSKNEKKGSVYGNVVLNPESKAISFEANGGTIDTEVTASQTYYDYYTAYEDGDIDGGKTALMNVASFTFADPVESGSYLDDFAASYQLIDGRHYIRVAADANTSTSGKSGYNATMEVAGEGGKKANIVISASQNAGAETYKYFIVAGPDGRIAADNTTVTFTYKIYRTTYVSGVYMSCAESNRKVKCTYRADSVIKETAETESGAFEFVIPSNKYNTESEKTHSATYYVAVGEEERTNFDGKTPDYIQNVIQSKDSHNEDRTAVEYTGYSAWIGDAADSEANVASIAFSKAGETKTLYGFSRETKTTRYYWSSDNTEDVDARVTEVLLNESVWSWSQPSSDAWTLSGTSARNASESVSANGEDTARTIEVTLNATSANKSTNKAEAKSTMQQAAGLDTKYFIVANADASIACTDTSASFGYSVIRNSYDGAGAYIGSAVYEGSGVDVKVTYSFVGETDNVTGTSRNITKTVSDNKHSETAKTYVAAFAFVDASLQDTQHLNVTIAGLTYSEDKEQTINQLADSKNGAEIVEYTDIMVSIPSVATFARGGETKNIQATTKATKIVYSTWASDGTKAAKKSEDRTFGDTADKWTWDWVTDSTNFEIEEGYENVNPTRVTVEENTTGIAFGGNITVEVILKADSTKSAEASATLSQEMGDILTALTLELIDPAHDGTIQYSENASYKVKAVYTASGEIDVTNDAVIHIMSSESGSETSTYVISESKGGLKGNNAGAVIPAVDAMIVTADKDSIETIETSTLTAKISHTPAGNQGSASQTVYLYADFGGMSTSRNSLVVEGQQSYHPQAMVSDADDALWYVNGYVQEEVVGKEYEFIPESDGTYVFRAVQNGIGGDKTITVEKTTNPVIASISDTALMVGATYGATTEFDLTVKYRNPSGDVVTVTRHLINLSDPVVLAGDVPYGSVITEFSGTPSFDHLYNFVYQFTNIQYSGIRLDIDYSEIDYNGGTDYKVWLVENGGNERDITDVCTVTAYNDEEYTEESDIVEISPSEGTITSKNSGDVIPAVDYLYVKPEGVTVPVGGSVTVNAFTKQKSDGRGTTESAVVYFVAEYLGYEDSDFINVSGDGGKTPEMGDEQPLVVNWELDNDVYGEISTSSGQFTTFTASKIGNCNLYAEKEDYIVMPGAAEYCEISVIGVNPASLHVSVNPTVLDYYSVSALSGEITFSDDTKKTYSGTEITHAGETYKVVFDYSSDETGLPDDICEITNATLRNSNAGWYIDDAPQVTVNPSTMSGWAGETFAFSISGQSTWESVNHSVYVTGHLMVKNGNEWEETGITDIAKHSDNDNVIMLKGQIGSNVLYSIKDWEPQDVKSGDNMVIIPTGNTTGKYGHKVEKDIAVITYYKGNGTDTVITDKFFGLGYGVKTITFKYANKSLLRTTLNDIPLADRENFVMLADSTEITLADDTTHTMGGATYAQYVEEEKHGEYRYGITEGGNNSVSITYDPTNPFTIKVKFKVSYNGAGFDIAGHDSFVIFIDENGDFVSNASIDCGVDSSGFVTLMNDKMNPIIASGETLYIELIPKINY